MKLTKGILAAVMMMGGAWAQNPNIINNVQNQMSAVSQKQTADSNAALGIQSTSSSAPAKKASTAAPAAAAKPTPVTAGKPNPAAKTASSAATKPASTPATNKVSAESAKNKLEQVKVIRHADDIEIEMATREAVTPTVDKLASPERVVVELPATAMATPESKIAIGASGIKGVRIGVNGKTPPTTSVVVDLEHAVAYEISPGASNKLVLKFHVQDEKQVAKKESVPPVITKSQPTQKAVAVASKPSAKAAPATVAKVMPAAAPKAAPATAAKVMPAVAKSASATAAVSKEKPIIAKPVIVAKAQMPAPAPKAAVAAAAPKMAKSEAPKAPSAAAKDAKVTIAAAKEEPKAATIPAAKSPVDEKVAPIATTADDSKAPKPEEKKWAMTGKRDPFFSPIVQEPSGGSGCSTGKKCLEIGQINVRGIVKSEAGFIAVVTNSMNKAYFLHENDPVFNGYVLRITGDSVVFQETYQDKFGKPLTREVTKTVVAPAV